MSRQYLPVFACRNRTPYCDHNEPAISIIYLNPTIEWITSKPMKWDEVFESPLLPPSQDLWIRNVGKVGQLRS